MGEDSNTIEDNLSDEAVEYAERHTGINIQIGSVVVPPIPRDNVQEYADGELIGHLYSLTDLALAINHAGDTILDRSFEEDEPLYDITRDSVKEIKVAHGALISSYNRELRACADRMGLEVEDDDYVQAIRDELGYNPTANIKDNFDEVKDERVEDYIDLDALEEERDSE